jgi:hypothetical protein
MSRRHQKNLDLHVKVKKKVKKNVKKNVKKILKKILKKKVEKKVWNELVCNITKCQIRAFYGEQQ